MNDETGTTTIVQADPYTPVSGDQILIQESSEGGLLTRYTDAYAELQPIVPQQNCTLVVKVLQDHSGYVELHSSEFGEPLRCWAAGEVQIYKLRFGGDADKFARFSLTPAGQPGLYYIRTLPELGGLYLSRWGQVGTGFKTQPDEFCMFKIWRAS